MKPKISPKKATEFLQNTITQLLEAHMNFYNNGWSKIQYSFCTDFIKSQIVVIEQIANGFKNLIHSGPDYGYVVHNACQISYLPEGNYQIIPKGFLPPEKDSTPEKINIGLNEIEESKIIDMEKNLVQIDKAEIYKLKKIEGLFKDFIARDFTNYLIHLIHENFLQNDKNEQKHVLTPQEFIDRITQKQEWAKALYIYCENLSLSINTKLHKECLLSDNISNIFHFFKKRASEIIQEKGWEIEFEDFELENLKFSQIDPESFIENHRQKIFHLLTVIGNFNSGVLFAEDTKTSNKSAFNLDH